MLSKYTNCSFMYNGASSVILQGKKGISQCFYHRQSISLCFPQGGATAKYSPLRVPGSRQLRESFQKILRINPVGKGYPALFSAGKGEGGEEEEWHITSVIGTLLPVQVGSLTAASPHPIG